MKLNKSITFVPGIILTKFEERAGTKFSGTLGAKYTQTPEGPRIILGEVEVRLEIFYGEYISVKFSVKKGGEYFDVPLTGHLDADTGEGTLMMPEGTKIVFTGYDQEYEVRKGPESRSLRLMVLSLPTVEKVVALALQRGPRKAKEKAAPNYTTATAGVATGEAEGKKERGDDDIPF